MARSEIVGNSFAAGIAKREPVRVGGELATKYGDERST